MRYTTKPTGSTRSSMNLRPKTRSTAGVAATTRVAQSRCVPPSHTMDVALPRITSSAATRDDLPVMSATSCSSGMYPSDMSAVGSRSLNRNPSLIEWVRTPGLLIPLLPHAPSTEVGAAPAPTWGSVPGATVTSQWTPPRLSTALHQHCRQTRHGGGGHCDGGHSGGGHRGHGHTGGGGGGDKRLRTPRTLTRLMQQHRDNERHRHQGLNASIREITKNIPGSSDASYETKIGKLQRIIHYICHLESHIQRLCGQVGLELQFKNLFLSPHLKGLQYDIESMLKVEDLESANHLFSQDEDSRLLKREQASPTCDFGTAPTVLDHIQVKRSPGSPQSLIGNMLNVPHPACTPEKTLDWLSNAADVFLSPDTASYLQAKGYDKVVDDLDFSSTFSKRASLPPSPEYLDFVNLSASDTSADAANEGGPAPEVVLGAEPDLGVVAEHVEVSSSAELPALLDHCQNVIFGDPVIESPDLAARVPSSSSREDQDDDDFVHLVPHLEGVDVSDDEPDHPPSGVKVEPIEAHHLPDDMFVSRLQNIEEDESDYLTPPSPLARRFFSPPPQDSAESSVAGSVVASPLFTMARLLREAGMSPQYLKYHALSGVGDRTIAADADAISTEPSTSSNNSSSQDSTSTSSSPDDDCYIISGSPHTDVSPDLAPPPPPANTLTPKDLNGRRFSNLKATSRVWESGLMSQSGDDGNKENRDNSQTGEDPQGLDLYSGCEDLFGERESTSRYPHTRVDYRRTSWMNGFMMYSRIHRREYIEAFPGVHTSHISKLMGQDWRGMRQAQQQPYREKAKEYIETILSPQVPEKSTQNYGAS